MCTGEPASIMLGTVEDLPQIYADMEQQFPPDEMYKYKNLLHLLHGDKYKILLYKRDSDGELLGYALVYTVENCNILWLDYIAILKQHQSHGYGNQLFNALWHKYCGPFDGILSVSYTHLGCIPVPIASHHTLKPTGSRDRQPTWCQRRRPGSLPLLMLHTGCLLYTSAGERREKTGDRRRRFGQLSLAPPAGRGVQPVWLEFV